MTPATAGSAKLLSAAKRAQARLSSDAVVTACCCGSVLLAAVKALLALPTHLWLDETGTAWAVNAGPAQIAARCATFPLSRAYAWLMLAVREVAGNRAWLLRLPSLCAAALAAAVLFRMARRIWGPAAAWLALAIFLSLPNVIFAATDARPYALGLLFVALSTSLSLRLVERPGWGRAAAYGVTAGVVPHFHVLFATALAAQGLYLAHMYFRRRAIPGKYLAAAAAAIAAIAAPLAGPALVVARQSRLHSFAAVPGPEDLVREFAPMTIGICALAAIGSMIVFRWPARAKAQSGSEELLLAGLLAVIPPLGLFAIARASGSGAFLPRYLLPGAAGLSLCFGALAGGLRPRRLAAVMAVALLVPQLYWFHPKDIRHTRWLGDWAAAVAYVDANTAADGAPVLIRSQYIESDVLPLAPLADNPLFSQLVCYPSRSKLTGIGVTFGERQMRQADAFLAAAAHGRPRFLVVAYDGPQPLDPLLAYLSGRLGPSARRRELANFDDVRIVEYHPGP
jgi:mannosyltransferase